MSKVLSIEVGNSLTKIVETDFRAKLPKVYKYFTIPTPDEVFDDGYIFNSEGFAETIRKGLAEHKIKTKQAVCTITCSKIANREVVLPALKSSQVESAIKANANEYFPIDLSKYELGHIILGTMTGEDSLPKLRVMVLACEKELIAGYEKLCEQAGLHLISADYSGNSLYQIMKKEVTEETEMVIKIEEQATIASVISKGSLMLQRNLGYGIDNMIQTMMASSAFPQKTYTDCLSELQRITCIRLSLTDGENVFEGDDDKISEKQKKAMADLTEALGPLIGNVSRVLDLYNSKNSERPITKVSLIGLGSQVSGLSKLFSRELGVKTVSVETVKSITWTQVMGHGNSGEYISPLGAAYAPVGFVNDEKKQNDIKAVNYKNLTVLTAILALAICASLGVFSYLPYKEALDRNNQLKTQEAHYLPGEAVHNQFSDVKALYDEIEKAISLTENNNDNIIAFLAELEMKLPKEALVTEFNSDNKAASLGLRVPDMQVAAKVIETLREFDSITDVSFGSISEGERQEAEKKNEIIKEAVEEGDLETIFENPPYFTFKAVCTYVPNGASEPDNK